MFNQLISYATQCPVAYDQYYIRPVSYHLAGSILETIPDLYNPSQLIIFGCGKPVLITPYITETGSAFPVFTGSSGKTYEKIHVMQTGTRIIQPPSYIQVPLFRAMGVAMRHIWKNRVKVFRGGLWNQKSERWMFQNGKHVYIRRMEHAEHLTAEKLLGILDCDVGRKPLL